MDPEEFKKLKDETQAIVDQAKSEKRDLTEDEMKTYSANVKTLTEATANAKRDSELEGLQLPQTYSRDNVRSAVGNDDGGEGDDGQSGDDAEDEDAKLKQRQKRLKREYAVHRAAVNVYMAGGDEPSRYMKRDGEGNQYTVTTTTGGGVILPKMVDQPEVIPLSDDAFRNAIAQNGGRIRRTTNTAQLSVPFINRTAPARSAANQPEGGNDTGQTEDPGITGVTLNAPLHTSKQEWYSNTEIAAMPDIIGDIEPELDSLIDIRREQQMAALIESNGTNGSTVTSGLPGYDDFLAAKYSLAAPWRRGRRGRPCWFLATAIMQHLDGLKDNDGRPIFLQSMRDGTPSTLLGMPVYEVPSFSEPTNGGIVGCIAGIRALLYRDVISGVGAPELVRYMRDKDRPGQIGYEKLVHGDQNFNPFGLRTIVTTAP